MRLFLAIFSLAVAGNAATFSGAALSFDGLKNQEQILNFYAGGFGDQGSGPGPNYGVTFSPGIAGDSTSIAFGPSALVTAPAVTMTLSDPSTQTLSFYFTGNGTVTFYSGPNATGNLLRAYALSYPPFFPFAATPGAFESVVFAPLANSVLRMDSITIADNVVIPEPAGTALVSAGILLMIGWRWLERRSAGPAI